MLYFRKFYVVQKIYIFISISIHRWDTGTQLQWQVTNMACNDLSARGAWGRDAPQAPPPQQLYIYIYKNKLSVWQLITPPPNSYISIYIKISCLCFCRVTSGVLTDVIVRIELYASWNCLSTDVMFVNWWNYRPGHKWRPGHGDTGNINDDREPQREITDWNTGTQGI